MNQESDVLARVASHLAEEIEAGHKAVMAAYGKADTAEYISQRMEFWKFAAHLMGAQIGAVRCLKGLHGRGEHHTFTYVHQGRPQRLRHPPTPQNLKTNVPPVLESGEGGDAEAVQRP